MKSAFTRERILEIFREKTKNKEPIIVNAPGIGLLSKMCALAGVDMQVICSAAKISMDGHPSITANMAYGDSNTMMLELARHCIKVGKSTPFVAGVASMDPYREMQDLFEELEHMGFSGVMNSPSACMDTSFFFGGNNTLPNVKKMVGVYDDVKLIEDAHNYGFLTIGVVSDEEEVELMVRAGADIIIPHVGFTVGGINGVPEDLALSLDEACEMTQRLCSLAKSLNPEVFVFAHGGVFNSPENVGECFRRTDVDGFFGNSALGRIPTEEAMIETIAAYVDLDRPGKETA